MSFTIDVTSTLKQAELRYSQLDKAWTDYIRASPSGVIDKEKSHAMWLLRKEAEEDLNTLRRVRDGHVKAEEKKTETLSFDVEQARKAAFEARQAKWRESLANIMVGVQDAANKGVKQFSCCYKDEEERKYWFDNLLSLGYVVQHTSRWRFTTKRHRIIIRW